MSLVLNKQKTLTEYKMEHEERCKYSYKKDNNFFCNIADGYKCPFNGRYHKMEHDIFGGKYINGQDKTGCEVCVASNCGFDKGKTDEDKNIKKINRLRCLVLSILEEANRYPCFYKCSNSDLKTILKDILSVIEE